MNSANPPASPIWMPDPRHPLAESAHRQVLLVEDDMAVAELIRLNLGHRKFEVVVSTSIDAARRCVEARLPEVVLLDWELPDGSGLLLLRHWRSESRTCDLPIIMLTGRSSTVDVKAATASGVNDYVTKPCAMADLTNRINKVIYGHLQSSTRPAG
jgi:two-component system phosphate regulon response regulator PhoB